MEELTLREYRAGDLDAMYALDVECFEPPFRFSRRAMRGFAESPGALTMLAEADGKLVGFCIVQMDGRVGYVVTLDVAQAWRRRKLARQLMAEAELKARAAGAVGMALHVFTGNAGAMHFYESTGYQRAGLAKGFYGRKLDGLVYSKHFQD